MHEKRFQLKCFNNQEQEHLYNKVANVNSTVVRDKLFKALHGEFDQSFDHITRSQNFSPKHYKAIPNICHYSWFGKRHQLSDLVVWYPNFEVEVKKNHQLLGCSIILWTSDQRLIPHTSRFIKQLGGEIKDLHIIKEFDPHVHFWLDSLHSLGHKYDYEWGESMFSLTNDILRYCVLKYYGGTYIDQGYIFNSMVTSIIELADLVVFTPRSQEFLLGAYALSAKKSHPFICKILDETLANLSYFIPFYTKNITLYRSGAKDIYIDNQMFVYGFLQNPQYHHILLNCDISYALDITTGLYAFTYGFIKYHAMPHEVNIIFNSIQSFDIFGNSSGKFSHMSQLGNTSFYTGWYLNLVDSLIYYARDTFNAVILRDLSPYYFSGNQDIINTHCNHHIFSSYRALHCIMKYKYNFDYYQFFWEEQSLERRAFRVEENPTIKIPRILHHIWLSDSSLKSPSFLDFSSVIESLRVTGWKGMLWQNSHVIHDNRDFCSSYHNLGGTIHHINELIQEERYGFFYAQLEETFNQKETKIPLQLTVEVLRAILLNEIGGVVVNIGYRFINIPEDAHYILDFYVGALNYQTVGGGYIAAAKGHPIIEKTLEIMSNNFIHNFDHSKSHLLRFLPEHENISCQGYVEYIFQGSLMLAYILELSQNTNYQSNVIFNTYLMNHTTHLPIQEYMLVNNEIMLLDKIGHQAYTGYWRDNCNLDTKVIIDHISDDNVVSMALTEDFYQKIVVETFYEQTHNYLDFVLIPFVGIAISYIDL